MYETMLQTQGIWISVKSTKRIDAETGFPGFIPPDGIWPITVAKNNDSYALLPMDSRLRPIIWAKFICYRETMQDIFDIIETGHSIYSSFFILVDSGYIADESPEIT